MSYNTKKSINQWTEKHDQFCLENEFTPSAKLLWQWLLREGKIGEDLEPDLKEFNKWVCRYRRKGYCRKTIKTAFNQLVECRVIRLVKQFTWHLVRIVTRTLQDLFPRKKSPCQDKTSVEQASNQEIAKKNEKSNCPPTQYEFQVGDRVEMVSECITGPPQFGTVAAIYDGRTFVK